MHEPRGRPEAILRPAAGRQAFEVERIAPSEALAEYVDYHWLVRWRVPEPHRQQVIPQPRIHIAAEDGRLLLHGVTREPFFRTLSGEGHVLGTAFHTGGFRPLLKRSLATIAGTVRPASDVLGPDDRDVAARILDAADPDVMVGEMERYLCGVGPEPDRTAREVTALVAEAERRTDVVRAEQLAAHANLSLRSLQRLFSEHIGIGPKWVIQRFRILEATAAAHAGQPVDWPALAGRLGFSDQAHLTRVFTQIVGTSPAAYQRGEGTL